MFRKSVAILIILALILGIFPSSLLLNTSAAENPVNHQTVVPSGFIGIYTAQDLYNVRNNLNGRYILMSDLDLTDETGEGGLFFNNGAGWEPIGDAVSPFIGTFDGNRFKITGLKETIKSSQFIYAGLFGYAKNANITNLGLENSSIYAENTSVDSSTSNVYAGGIVGYGYNVTISNSYTTGTISAPSLFNGYAGGIAGYVTSAYNMVSTISDCYNTGMVYAKTSAGGIAAYTYRTNISNVHNKGMFTSQASGYAGGIVGDLNSNSTITNAYNSGDINFRSVGGGIAGRSSSSSISNSYNQGELNGTDNSSYGGGIVGSANSSTISKTYNKGKISSSAKSSDGGGIVGSLSSTSSVVDSYNTADISADITAGGIAGTSSGIISKTYNTGTITGTYTGGMSGWSSGGITLDCFNIGLIKGKYKSGGIVGYATNTTIKNTYNVGSVDSTYYYVFPVGGIAGEFSGGSIENSYYLDLAQTGVGEGIKDGTYRETFDQMKDPATFNGFDFSTTWNFDGNSSFHFPTLGQTPGSETVRNLAISITSLPDKTEYVQGEALDLTGSVITVRKNDGNEFNVPVTADMVKNYNPNSIGSQSIQINYDGLVTYFNIVVKYQVTFKDYDGRILKTEAVSAGGAATPPDAPERKDYIFSGWSPDYHNVKSNLTVIAQYTIKSYNVTYMDGDSVVDKEGYNADAVVTPPMVPTKPGYTFLDWYVDPQLQTKYSFFNLLTGDITLYAKFVESPPVPQALTVGVAAFDKLNISWSPVNGVDGYRIDRADSINGDFNWGYVFSTDNKNYVVDSLKPGTTYYFKIRSYRMVDGNYIYSSYSPVIAGTPMVAGITSFKAFSSGYDKVTLSWAKSSEASGYEVYRAETPTGAYTQVGTTTALSYTNSGLTTGKTYYYKVRAYRMVDGNKANSSYSSMISAMPLLSSVGSVTAASSSYNSIKTSWAAVSGANGYEVYRSASSTGTYALVGTTTSTSFINGGLATNYSYYYKIRAYKIVGSTKLYSNFSSIVSAKPIPATPTGIKAASSSYNSLKISWVAVSGSSGYEVYRATSNSGPYSLVGNTTSTGLTNTGLTTNRLYFYKIRAYRMVGKTKVYSNYSAVVSAKPVPSVPTNFKSARLSSTSVKITWSAVSGANGYELYRSTTYSGTYSLLKSTTSVSYTNSGLVRGRIYYYKVRAYRMVGSTKVYSGWTSIISGKTY